MLNANTAVISMSGKETNVIWKNMLFAWKSQPFWSKVFQEHANLKRNILRNLNARKSTSSMTTQSLLIFQKQRTSVSLDHTANAVDMSKYKNKILAHVEIENELVKIFFKLYLTLTCIDDVLFFNIYFLCTDDWFIPALFYSKIADRFFQCK